MMPALHGLLCEPKPLVEEIEQDMVDWIQARCQSNGYGSDQTLRVFGSREPNAKGRLEQR
jgi:hypothetical protein